MLDISDGREYRTFELRQAEASHKLTGYAVVFNSETEIDRDPYTGTTYLEKIDRRALDTCDMSDVILNIDHQGPPLARTKAGSLTLTPDDHGLRVDATLSTTRGRELWEDVVAGNLSQMSFAFTVDAEDYDSRNHLRTIQKIGKIWDVSVVTRAAYPQTEIYARSSMAGHMEQERRAVVEATLAELRSAVAKDPPLTREKVMENRSDLGAALLDLYRRSELTAKLAEIRSWEPEGRPEDAQTAREKSKQLQEVIQELEDIDREIADKLEKRGKHGQYGDDDGPGYRLYPSDLAVFVCRDILTGRGCAPIGRSEAMVNARGLGADKLRWIARACDADEDEVVRKYLTNNKEEKPEPPAPLSTLSTQKNLNQRRNFAMESIETRALQSYLCKGVSNMTEDERRALTTTGSGSATIPTAIVDRLISTAGLSILTHRATHLADGRPGKLVRLAPGTGGYFRL